MEEPEREDKHLKTSSARRIVPLHDYESESISMKQIFLMLNGVVSCEPLRKSVTKWTLLVKKGQYNVFLILEGWLKN